MAHPPPPSQRLTLPAALVRVWEEHGRAEDLAAAREALRDRPGVLWTGPNLCAVVPEPGDPAVFDTALAVAAELAAAIDGAGPGGSRGGLRILVLPGQVEVPAATVAANPLLDETERLAPTLEAGKLYLTSHAASRLEVRRKLRQAGTFQGPGGLHAPLVQALGEDPEAPPFRNPKVLSRRSAYARRPELDAALAAAAPLTVLTGPAGCGKSRALWEALAGPEALLTWASLRPSRQGGPALASRLLLRTLAAGAARNVTFQGLADLGVDEQRIAAALPGLLAQLGKAAGRPGAVVVDDLEAATPGDLACLQGLAEAARSGGGFRLFTAGRTAPAWLLKKPAVHLRVGPLPAAAAEIYLAQVAAGLSLPGPFQARLLEAAAGNPFALEEGLIALASNGLIRQVFGSFFFGGGEDVPYHPSERLIRHAESEARRLGAPRAARLLAVAGMPVPPDLLAAAGAEPPAAGWPTAWVRTGFAEVASSPWGDAVRLLCPAFGEALRATLPENEVSAQRLALGRALPGEVRETAWQRYRLLATSSLGLAVLLEALAEGKASAEDLYQALVAELEALRVRSGGEPGGQPQLELLILWHLLPLARRLGRMKEHADDLGLARALAKGDTKKALALAGLAAELEEQEGRLPDAEATLRQALAAIGGRDRQAGALLALHLARLLIRQERQQDARELLERLLPHLESGKAETLAASALFHLGNVAVHQHRLRDALALHEKALAIRRGHDKPKALGGSLSALGRVALLEGRYADALAFYREAESALAAGGDKGEVGYALLGTGKALCRLGNYAAASGPLQRALALREQGDDAAGEAIARLAVAENHLHLKRYDRALNEARKAHFDLRLASALNAALGDAERLIASALFAKRQLAEAERGFTAALAAHRRVGDREAITLDLAAWLELAMAAADEGKVEGLAVELESFLGESLHLERRELPELRLYQALSWLARRGNRPRGALPHLRLAYRLLLAKADPLEPQARHTFLFQVREHQEIIAIATQEGLAWAEAPTHPAR